MALEPLKDILGTEIEPGDRVALLVKSYGFAKISNAYLYQAIYIGIGRYGYEFVDLDDYESYKEDPENPFDEEGNNILLYRQKSPQCVKIVESK